VLCAPFRALTLEVGWQEGHPACRKPHSINLQRFSSGTGGGGPEAEPAEPGSPRKKTQFTGSTSSNN